MYESSEYNLKRMKPEGIIQDVFFGLISDIVPGMMQNTIYNIFRQSYSMHI